MNLYEAETLSVEQETKKKIEIIAQILDYPQYKAESVEKKVARFDNLYDRSLPELIIFSKVYK